MKYELKNVDQYIQISVAYTVEVFEKVEMTYIITDEILDQYDIESKSFISYLCGHMDYLHKDYESCNQLWAQNKPIYQKNIDSQEINSIKNIKTVFTEDGEIHLRN